MRLRLRLRLLRLRLRRPRLRHEVECGLILDVVVRQCMVILKLLVREDQTLLVWRNSFLVLDLCLDIDNGVRCLGV